MEQHVDMPVPGRVGRISGLQGFLPEQIATAFGEADHRFPAASVEQIVDFSVSGGGFQIFHPRQSSASSSHSPADFADDAFQEFFSHLSPKQKKARQYLRTWGRNCLRTRAHGRRLHMALEEGEGEEESQDVSDYDVEYVEFDGCWWGCEWVPARHSIAGGWPSQMGHRLAILFGGPCGSLAEGQGDWSLVRQWIHGLR